MKDSLLPAVSYASPDLPVGLLKVVDAGLTMKPQERPQSAVAYIQALLAAAEGFVPSVEEQVPDLPDFPVHIPERRAGIRWAVLLLVTWVFFCVLSCRVSR